MGFEVIDENLLNVINFLREYFQRFFSDLIVAGQGIGAIMALFVIAGEAYKVMVKQKGFDILAILRPIAISLVLVNWIFFVDAVGSIPRGLERYSKSVFDNAHVEVIAMREARTEAAKNVKERVQKAKAAADMAEAQIEDGNVFDRLMEMGEDMMTVIQDQLYSFATIWQAQANQFLEEWVLKIGEFFWQIQVYLLFFIKEVFASILIISGPITFGLSVLPAWKDAWSQWIARYVSVLLYGFIGYFVMAAALQITRYGIHMDTLVLNTANSTQEAFAAYTSSSVVTALYHFITLIVGGCAIKMIPELATWIIPANSGMAAKEFVGGAYGSMKKTATTGFELATGSKK